MKTMTRIVAIALLAVMCVSMLVSCGAPNADPEKAKAALEEAGYSVIAAPVNYKGLESGLVASKGLLSSDSLMILYFIDSDSAEAAFEEMKADEEEKAEKDDNYVFKCSGKMIYAGHKNAVKAAK